MHAVNIFPEIIGFDQLFICIKIFLYNDRIFLHYFLGTCRVLQIFVGNSYPQRVGWFVIWRVFKMPNKVWFLFDC